MDWWTAWVTTRQAPGFKTASCRSGSITECGGDSASSIARNALGKVRQTCAVSGDWSSLLPVQCMAADCLTHALTAERHSCPIGWILGRRCHQCQQTLIEGAESANRQALQVQEGLSALLYRKIDAVCARPNEWVSQPPTMNSSMVYAGCVAYLPTVRLTGACNRVDQG